jgi:acetyl esterase/lipase
VPVHHEFAERFPLLEGVETFEAFMSDPQHADRFAQFVHWDGAEPPTVETFDTRAPGLRGDVPLRVYSASSPEPRPVLVWIHGGGFFTGGLDMAEADWTAREIAARADAVVVSVDYRLAVGGVCYPVPLDDCVAATRWVRAQCESLGADADRVFIGGGSAGANLSVGTVLRLRDEEGWQPQGVLPTYGLFHPRLPAMSSRLVNLMNEVPPALRFPPGEVEAMTANYLGGPHSQADGYAMPGLADLEGLCEVTLIHAEYDALRASGEAFAAQLALAGVDVSMVTAPGMLHGFLNLPSRVEPVGHALDLMAGVVRARATADAASGRGETRITSTDGRHRQSGLPF